MGKPSTKEMLAEMLGQDTWTPGPLTADLVERLIDEKIAQAQAPLVQRLVRLERDDTMRCHGNAFWRSDGIPYIIAESDVRLDHPSMRDEEVEALTGWVAFGEKRDGSGDDSSVNISKAGAISILQAMHARGYRIVKVD